MSDREDLRRRIAAALDPWAWREQDEDELDTTGTIEELLGPSLERADAVLAVIEETCVLVPKPRTTTDTEDELELYDRRAEEGWE